MEGNPSHPHTYPSSIGNVTTQDENGSTLVEMLNRIDALDSIPQLQVNQSSSVETVTAGSSLEIGGIEIPTTLQNVPPSIEMSTTLQNVPPSIEMSTTMQNVPPSIEMSTTLQNVAPSIEMSTTLQNVAPITKFPPTTEGLQPQDMQPITHSVKSAIQPNPPELHPTTEGISPTTHGVPQSTQVLPLTNIGEVSCMTSSVDEGLSGMVGDLAANLIVQLPTEVSSEISIPSKNKVGRPRTRPPKEHHEWHYHLGGVRHCRVPLAPELREVLEVAYMSKILSNNLRKEGQPEKERIARITGMSLDKIQEWFKNRRKKDRLRKDKAHTFQSPRRRSRKSTEDGSVSGTDQSLSSTTEHAPEDIAMETVTIGQQ